jgi:DNA-binding NtrC family response regulator
MLKASVLIVGDDPHLLRTYAELLPEWQVATARPSEAEEAIRAFAFDLLIISQIVSETAARILLALAINVHPQPKVLVVGQYHREWYLGSAAFYTVNSIHPCKLQTAVATLLACDQSQPSEIARLRRMVS